MGLRAARHAVLPSRARRGLRGTGDGAGDCTPIQLSSSVCCSPTLSQALPMVGQMLPSPPELFLPVTIFNRPAKGRGRQPPTICSDSWDAPRATEPGPQRVLPVAGVGRGVRRPLIHPTSPPLGCQPGLRPRLACTPCTAEPAGPARPRHNCGRILPGVAGLEGRGVTARFPSSSGCSRCSPGGLGTQRGRGAGTCWEGSLPLRPASCDTREHAPFPERKMT